MNSFDIDEIPPAKNVGRKRMIDETTLSPEDAEQLEVKRAYNRRCASEGTFFESAKGSSCLYSTRSSQQADLA